jgi:DNA-3-methyladenine glycosylase II
MQRNQTTETLVSQGCFELEGGEALLRWVLTSAHQRYAPEQVDPVHGWFRLLPYTGTEIEIRVCPSGSVLWHSSVVLTNEKVQRHLQRLFLPKPLAEVALAHVPANLASRFLASAPLTHIASASLGEAVIKAVIRQVIAASHARKLIWTLVTHVGSRRESDGGTIYGFPSLEVVAHLAPDDLRSWGFGYKATLLPRIAHDLLEQQAEEQMCLLSPEEAILFLQQVKGIGRWTAHVAVCDVTGDWSMYPFEDLAVRTWARKLWPERVWPQEERAFLDVWQEVNGPHTGLITCYLLAQAGRTNESELLRQTALV